MSHDSNGEAAKFLKNDHLEISKGFTVFYILQPILWLDGEESLVLNRLLGSLFLWGAVVPPPKKNPKISHSCFNAVLMKDRKASL